MRLKGFCFLLLVACACQRQHQEFDIIVRQGTVYDGSGQPGFGGDVAINGDTIAAIGDLSGATGKKEIDATGLAVAPGFVNMLSWSTNQFINDGRAMSDIKQGVTLLVFGEGWSPAPRVKLNRNDSLWTSFDEYFRYVEKKGVSPNVASFVGATTVRMLVLNQDNRAPSETELEKMKHAVKQAMEEGAMGVGSSLIYAPADYASTDELIQLCKVASEQGGMYITHIRSESDKIYSALNEAFRIAREADIPTEIYHLKINHQRNWNKIDTVLAKIDSAQKAGLKITANMYTYTASGTGLTARIPTWVQEGGGPAMRRRLRNPALRKRVLKELKLGIPTKNSDPHDVLVMGFRKDSLNKLYKGKRLDEIAKLHRKNADETMLDLVTADRSSVGSIFFLMSEDNLKRFLKLPFVSFCSDAGPMAAEPPYLDEGTHPRAYGAFARLLGKYVHEEKLITLEEAVRRLAALPAENMKIKKRGRLAPGYFADLAIFDPEKISDHGTYEQPHQYATGMVHVLVNGVPVLENGSHTGARPGRAIRGPGWKRTP